MAKCSIGLMGLAVMGQNLVLNMEDHGYSVAVYNRTTSKVDDFCNSPEVKGKGRNIVPCYSLEELVANLERPRKVMLMIQSKDPVPAPEVDLYPNNAAVDAVIAQLLTLLEPGDVIIDGGNTHFRDTDRRTKYVESKGLLYIGTGVSGGEEGARKGPSLMPGGSPQAWPLVKDIFQSIAAKVGPNHDIPCCEWIGPRGAGHYVKMVHNGIEYGDMQLICEAYWLLKNVLGLTNDELYDVFAEWNKGDLDSYLIEITRDIFSVKDDKTGNSLVDYILDTAGAKGTGKWMSQLALDLGAPSTLVTEAVYARSLSAQKKARVAASKVLVGPQNLAPYAGCKKEFIEAVRKALYASKICSYAQGYVQMQMAAAADGWDLQFGQIALLWRGGCIIRAVFLQRIKDAFDKNPKLGNLLLDDYFQTEVTQAQDAWRLVVKTAVERGIPCPAISGALAYYDGYRSERLSANLLQAQRDYFGAHTYRRIDCDESEIFHTEWISLRKQPE
ncbi:MAG: decarboxylating NADP(+)-dependent phosphogluconate dehydrogenase [Planctomycetia bacterium]|nr:decarboxylating NADP(+)-dependent phosphogluconate dehydrogenase [Planctomycetia bacterium]